MELRSRTALRLNGWQRLWVLITVMWAVPGLLAGLTFWPEHADWFSDGSPYCTRASDYFAQR
jgi:hypothetical protein